MKIEEGLDEISNINNEVNKKNISILFERVGILPQKGIDENDYDDPEESFQNSFNRDILS